MDNQLPTSSALPAAQSSHSTLPADQPTAIWPSEFWRGVQVVFQPLPTADNLDDASESPIIYSLLECERDDPWHLVFRVADASVPDPDKAGNYKLHVYHKGHPNDPKEEEKMEKCYGYQQKRGYDMIRKMLQEQNTGHVNVDVNKPIASGTLSLFSYTETMDDAVVMCHADLFYLRPSDKEYAVLPPAIIPSQEQWQQLQTDAETVIRQFATAGVRWHFFLTSDLNLSHFLCFNEQVHMILNFEEGYLEVHEYEDDPCARQDSIDQYVDMFMDALQRHYLGYLNGLGWNGGAGGRYDAVAE
ncbi:hypothetical protein FA95DRAFT_1569579 [Auriscalpium vulgare]|uniref:Uncharacterized protein n=1 Tax=Auriscalpium vulgare TaxID=40419 RepID=A0ACB8S7R1_9AGAM|nr:hypothetical protein FA95DRAFT_1569579 [Auriscalpium vulgare]